MGLKAAENRHVFQMGSNKLVGRIFQFPLGARQRMTRPKERGKKRGADFSRGKRGVSSWEIAYN